MILDIENIDAGDTSIPYRKHRIRIGDTVHRFDEWHKYLPLTKNQIVHRYNKHGLSPLIYATYEEYVNVDKSKFPMGPKERHARNVIGNEKWRKLSTKPVNSKHPDAEFGTIINLITRIIQDAKDNMVEGNEKYFKDSKRFLMNKNGQLAYLIACIPYIDVCAALNELKEFATTGFLKEREEWITSTKKGRGKGHTLRNLKLCV